MTTLPEGQLSPQERQMLSDAVLKTGLKPQVIVEVGTWLGGGSTVTFLRALHQNGTGHLWGVEADPKIYERMIENLKLLAPEALHRFTPLFGFSDQVLPSWLVAEAKPFQIDIAFLDGGNNPGEQITEFEILDPYFPVGAQLFSHDARSRKGKWLVPFLSRLDNWESNVQPFEGAGLLSARKLALAPSPQSLRAAKAHLRKLRYAPIELLARFSPKGLKQAIFSFIPSSLTRQLAEGRRT